MNERLLIAAILLSAALATAGDWPQFRGPGGTGVSDETGLPTTWNDKTNVKWKVDLPGRSVSSPIVVGKKLFMSSASGPRFERLHALCLDADTGKVLWHRQLTATGNTACHPKSSMAAPTPCANSDGVYFLYSTADLAAFDFDGNLKWYRSLVGDYPDISNQVGMAASPVVWKDSLIVPMDNVGDSFIAALDASYGTNIWKAPRPKDINWVTPTLRTVGDRTQVLFQSMKGAVAYDAADGKEAWTFTTPGGAVPTAVLDGNNVLLPFNGGTMLLKPDGKGMAEVWKSPKLATGYTSPTIYKDRVYGIGRAGTVVCVDLKNGREVWSERIGKGTGQFWASPIAGDGHLYAFDDAGICTVLNVGGAKAEIVAVNEMKAEIMGTAAIANGSLYIPTTNGLYCISAKK